MTPAEKEAFEEIRRRQQIGHAVYVQERQRAQQQARLARDEAYRARS